MSTTYNHEFTGRRPSKLQVQKVVKQAIESGAVDISLDWGENWLRLEKVKTWSGALCWQGYGWFKSFGGDDIAQQLNGNSPRPYGRQWA